MKTKKLTLSQKQKLSKLLETSKLYPNYYTGQGRFSKKSADYALQLEHLLTSLSFTSGKDFTAGNDAPKQGHTGKYISLTNSGKTLLSNFIK